MIGTTAVLAARLIFGGAFLIALIFKLTGIDNTASAIASIGLPFPHLLAWVAAIFELCLVLAFVTGAFFREAAALAALYVLFLGFAFYGPATWHGNPVQMGFFINHLTFLAGLLFAAVHGPGRTLTLDWTILRMAPARPRRP